MKWIKTIKAKWLLLIVVVMQLGIWVPPYLFGTSDEMVQKEESAVLLRHKPMTVEDEEPAASAIPSPAPERTSIDIENEIAYLEGLLTETTDENIASTLNKRIGVLEQEELEVLRAERLRLVALSRESEKPERKHRPHKHDQNRDKESNPTLNTDQPTPLIYADWLLINWQAILSILTILPIVVMRWKTILTGKQITTESE